MSERDERERERAIRENTRPRCPECGGSFWLPSGFVPHARSCPWYAKPRKPQSEREQDAERAALSELEAPFMPMIRWPAGPSALSDFVHQRPERRKRRLY